MQHGQKWLRRSGRHVDRAKAKNPLIVVDLVHMLPFSNLMFISYHVNSLVVVILQFSNIKVSNIVPVMCVCIYIWATSFKN